MNILQANQVNKTIETKDNKLFILKGVNIKVNLGESVVILGVSGSGKSTLLSILAGLDNPTSGEIILLGKKLTSLTEDARARLRQQSISFVFQNFLLIPYLSALENVMLPCEIAGLANVQVLAEEALHKVGLSERMASYPEQLSGGEQQRVAMARALVIKPKILFADEPTGSLDEQTGAKIIDLLFHFNTIAQTTLILVTHDPMLAQHARSQYKLEHGVLQKI